MLGCLRLRKGCCFVISNLQIHWNMEDKSDVKCTSTFGKSMGEDGFTKSLRSNKKRKKGPHRDFKPSILEIHHDLFERFQQFTIAQAYSKISKALHSSIGKHTPITYDINYNFKQQWQIATTFEDQQQFKTSIMYGLINMLVLLVTNVAIFLISLKLLFPIPSTSWIYYLVIIVCLFSMLQNIFLDKQTSLKQRSAQVLKQAACIITCLIILITESHIQEITVLGLIIIVHLYLKSCIIYMYIKIFHMSSKYREIVEIFDLFLMLLTISHVFALLIYLTTKFNPENNWLTKIDLHDGDWWTKYIYSLYFSCTTLLTVGYGDISPTNVAEILMILLVQFFGIAVFAFAVNKIGAALTNISERAQKLQKDLGNVENICNQYKLRPELVSRMRTELVKENQLQSEINLAEENELFSKFSEDLRETISVETSMTVLKRSMFMIANWTGKMQGKIAMKLVKQIFAVDDFLPQSQGKEKMYILEKGKIDIINNSRPGGFKGCFQKVLKTISVSPQTEVLVQNVYGYSFVISSRPIHLNAIAKSNCVCYSLSKSDLFELLAESEEDLQHFHEVKSQIQLSNIPEEVEAPSIVNIREHYCPSPHFVISSFARDKQKNVRCLSVRSERRMSLNVMDFKQQATVYSKMGTRNRLGSVKLLKQTDPTQSKEEILPQQSQEIYGFQACKQYHRYFKKANYDKVVHRFKTRLLVPSARYSPKKNHSKNKFINLKNSNTMPFP